MIFYWESLDCCDDRLLPFDDRIPIYNLETTSHSNIRFKFNSKKPLCASIFYWDAKKYITGRRILKPNVNAEPFIQFVYEHFQLLLAENMNLVK